MLADTKEQRIAASLRRRIVEGALRPGSPVPTFAELEREFSVSRLTMQRAMGRLKRQNFIVTRHRQGMSVAPRPPHLNRYGLVLGYHERYNRFWANLLQVASEIAETEGREFAVFRNLGRPNFQIEEWQRLQEEAAEQCLAGVFVVFNRREIPEFESLARLPLPVVALDDPEVPGQPRVWLDYPGFMRRAIEALAGQGRRRVAMLGIGDHNSLQPEMFRQAAAALGLSVPPGWCLPIVDRTLAEALVHLLVSLPPGQRPNGLLLADDHLIEPATRGLLQAGVKVPEDLAVLAHCNWSSPVACPLPIMRLGFEPQAVIRAAVERIDAIRRGAPILGELAIPAVFAHECRYAVPSSPVPFLPDVNPQTGVLA